MKALNLHAVGDIRYEEVPMPEPAGDEALIKVMAAGICGSDIPRVFSKGTYRFPTIPGHEFAGEIVAVGEGCGRELVGKRAAVFPLLPCFVCDACKNEAYASCVSYDYYGSRRDGAFAEYIAVKIWNLVFVPDSVSILWAAMTEPCAVAVHAVAKAAVKAGDTVCIFGAGTIGLIIAQLARGLGAENVILFDIDEKKRAFARQLGFRYAFDNSDTEWQAELLGLTGGKGAEVCIDAAGFSETVSACFRAAAAFATVVLMGNPAGDILLKQNDYWEILRKQLTLKGTWNSDYGSGKNDWKTALSYMESGAVDLSGFVTHSFALPEAKAAFDFALDRKEFYVKIMFLPHGNEKDGKQ